MPIKVKTESLKITDLKKLQKKAALFDELMAIIENTSLAYLMQEAEHEKNIPLNKANL